MKLSQSRVEGGVVTECLSLTFQVARVPKDGPGLSGGRNVSRLVYSSERHHLTRVVEEIVAKDSGLRIRIDLGRTLMRIGWHWAALGTTRFAVAKGPFLLREGGSHPENALN